MTAEIHRFEDEIDANMAARRFIHGLARSRLNVGPIDVEEFRLCRADEDVILAGRVLMLWAQDRPLPIAQATVVRDAMNFSVVTCIRFEETAGITSTIAADPAPQPSDSAPSSTEPHVMPSDRGRREPG